MCVIPYIDKPLHGPGHHAQSLGYLEASVLNHRFMRGGARYSGTREDLLFYYLLDIKDPEIGEGMKMGDGGDEYTLS